MSVPMVKENPGRELRDVTISQLRLQGKSMREIAEVMDCSKMTVSRVLKDDAIKEILEAGTQEIIASVPLAVANIQEFAKGKDPNYKYKASKDILEMANIAPGKVSNTYIANIYQQNNTTVVDPIVMQAMAAFIDPEEAEVIE